MDRKPTLKILTDFLHQLSRLVNAKPQHLVEQHRDRRCRVRLHGNRIKDGLTS